MPDFLQRQQDAEPEVQRTTVDELLALSIPDLVKYMRQNIGPNGSVELTAVEGLFMMSKAKREQFRERLLSAAEMLAAEMLAAEMLAAEMLVEEMLAAKDSNATQSSPVDANQLAALLSKVQQNGTTWSLRDVSSSSSRDELAGTPTPPPEPPEVDEAIKYHDLVREGGRPLFPLDRLNDIANDPGAYRALLRPWVNDPDAPKPDDWKVFRKQLNDWRDFRKWQRDNRNDEFNNEKECAMFCEERRNNMISQGLGYRTERPGWENDMKDYWARVEREFRLKKWKTIWEYDDKKGFPGYIEAARRRLKEHNFTQPFQFQEDTALQDTWTTWVEYIEFTCWRLDRDIKTVQRLQLRHDAEWKTLVETGVLRDTETPENVCRSEAVRARIDELLRTPGLPFNILDKGPKRVEVLRNRDSLIYDFCKKTESYRYTKQIIRHRKALLQSLIELAPQIWDEEQEKRRQAAAEDLQVDTNSKKRGGHEVQEPEEPNTKRRRGDTTQITGQVDSPARTTAVHPEAIEVENMVEKLPVGVTSEGAAAQQPTSKAAKQSPRELPRKTGSQTTTARTRDEWMACLRDRPRKKRIQQPIAQVRQSKTLAGAKKPVSATKGNRGRPRSRKCV